MAENLIPIGSFVRVGDDVGIVVGWPDTEHVPSEHYAVWYGSLDESAVPCCRTVPIEYCEPVDTANYYL